MYSLDGIILLPAQKELTQFVTNHVPQKLYQTTLVLLLKGALVIQTIGELSSDPGSRRISLNACV